MKKFVLYFWNLKCDNYVFKKIVECESLAQARLIGINMPEYYNTSVNCLKIKEVL